MCCLKKYILCLACIMLLQEGGHIKYTCCVFCFISMQVHHHAYSMLSIHPFLISHQGPLLFDFERYHGIVWEFRFGSFTDVINLKDNRSHMTLKLLLTCAI